MRVTTVTRGTSASANACSSFAPRRTTPISWTGPVGTAARIASVLQGWRKLRFEVTEEPTATSEGERYSGTPVLGVHRSALEASGLAASDIIHVNAHATSTPQGDGAEALAIRAALGSATDGIAVSGTKSMTGHLLGGAGAVESVAAILALRHRIAPVTANLQDRDDSIDLDVVSGSPRTLRDGDAAVLNNSFGFGGHNVALIFRSI